MSSSAEAIALEGDGEQKKRPDVRVYLEEKVFPVLTNGLEELLRAVEDREKKLKDQEEEEPIPEIHPLLFLARYLMRNAPKNSEKSTGRGSSKSRSSKSGDDNGSVREDDSAHTDETND